MRLELNPWQVSLDKIYTAFGLHNSPILIPDSDRGTLAQLFRRLDYKYGAEIGVERGIYSETLCRENPGVKLIGVDLYQPYNGYADFRGDFYEEASARLQPYGVDILRKSSSEAVRDFPDSQFDFVYIDCNHDSPWIDNDIYWWSKKVRPGGIVSGHDYVGIHKDVMRAVDEFVARNHIRPWFLVGDPAEATEANTVCSWFWVKGENELAR